MFILVDVIMIISSLTIMVSGRNDIEIEGTDIKLSYGVRYAFRSISGGNYLDGRFDEINPVLSPGDIDSNRFLQWTIVESEHGYGIRSVSSGNYLDGRNGEINPVLSSPSDESNLNRFLSFRFEKTNGIINGIYPRIAIRGVASGRYLDGRSPNDIDPVMSVGPATDRRFLQWEIIPINYKLDAFVTEFDFGDIENQLESQKSVAFIDSKTVSADIIGLTVEGSFTASIEESFSFGFEQSVGIGIETEINAGIPLIGGASTTISASFEFSANQQKTMTRTREYTQSYSFEPQEPGLYEVGIMVFEDVDAQLPFTSRVIIRGTSNDGRRVFNGQELLGIIYYQGFTGKVIDVYDNMIEAEITGTLRASYAVSSEIYNQYVGDE